MATRLSLEQCTRIQGQVSSPGRETFRSASRPTTPGSRSQHDEVDGEQFDSSNGTGSSHINGKPVLPDPTQAEIRRLCWAIQDTWSPAEAQRRAGVYVHRPVEVDVVEVAEHYHLGFD
jgi:hypothetical protein